MANASPSLTARSIQVPEFSSGTHGVIRAIAVATARGSVTVIGGECQTGFEVDGVPWYADKLNSSHMPNSMYILLYLRFTSHRVFLAVHSDHNVGLKGY